MVIIMGDMIYKEQLLTDNDLAFFESFFCKEIPLSFKNFYKKNNGGFLSEEDMEAGVWGLPVNGFYSIKYGEKTIEKMVNNYGDLIPCDDGNGGWKKFTFIPFSYDNGGNPIFVSLRESDYGCVYIYAPDGDNLFKISNSFEEFISRLYKKPFIQSIY